eukprot:GHRR01029221.1.p2 GENE.GHRR01029221.1~~GHRR01029221.1.p2  ORF type:complete len:105 (+),score=22.09 GHRR01029221.1:840-1154(+)
MLSCGDKPAGVLCGNVCRTHLGLVMEYVAGGNMADYILKTILLKFGSFDTRDGLVMEEDEARYFFTQIINAVEYCHNNKVAHRWVQSGRQGDCLGRLIDVVRHC